MHGWVVAAEIAKERPLTKNKATERGILTKELGPIIGRTVEAIGDADLRGEDSSILRGNVVRGISLLVLKRDCRIAVVTGGLSSISTM